MIEKILLDYLTEKLNVKVAMEVPETQHERYVVIEKTGSGCEDFINRATFAIQSYAPTLYEAAQLNEEVKEVLNAAVYELDISKAELDSDYNFTDTVNKRYRYQAVYVFYY